MGHSRRCGRSRRLALTAAGPGSINLPMVLLPLWGIRKERQSEARTGTESSCTFMASFGPQKPPKHPPIRAHTSAYRPTLPQNGLFHADY